MHPKAEEDPAQAVGQRVRQLLLRSGIQPSLSGTVKAAGPGILWKETGRGGATCKEVEVLTDTSEYSDTSIHILMLCNFSPRFEKGCSWQVYVSDSQILCTGGQT